MSTELLYQVLLGVLIAVGLFVIALLWRLIEILSDIKASTNILSKRVRQADSGIDKILVMCRSFKDFWEGMTSSFDFFKGIKEKYDTKREAKETKEKDGE